MPIGAAVATIGAAAIGASVQSKAAKKAANAQVAAADQANQTQLDIYNADRDLLNPTIRNAADARARQLLMMGWTPTQVRQYLAEQNAALNAPGPGETNGGAQPSVNGGGGGGFSSLPGLGFLGGFGQEQVDAPEESGAPSPGATPGEDPYAWIDDWSWEENDPYISIGRDKAIDAYEKSASARGRLFSGASATNITDLGEEWTRRGWGNYWSRLGELSGDGQEATGDVINIGGDYANNVSRNQLAAGDARASGYMNQANIWGGFWGDVAGGIGMGKGQGWFG